MFYYKKDIEKHWGFGTKRDDAYYDVKWADQILSDSVNVFPTQPKLPTKKFLTPKYQEICYNF